VLYLHFSPLSHVDVLGDKCDACVQVAHVYVSQDEQGPCPLSQRDIAAAVATRPPP